MAHLRSTFGNWLASSWDSAHFESICFNSFILLPIGVKNRRLKLWIILLLSCCLFSWYQHQRLTRFWWRRRLNYLRPCYHRSLSVKFITRLLRHRSFLMWLLYCAGAVNHSGGRALLTIVPDICLINYGNEHLHLLHQVRRYWDRFYRTEGWRKRVRFPEESVIRGTTGLNHGSLGPLWINRVSSLIVSPGRRNRRLCLLHLLRVTMTN